jgi:hypothetical protein
MFSEDGAFAGANANHTIAAAGIEERDGFLFEVVVRFALGFSAVGGWGMRCSLVGR